MVNNKVTSLLESKIFAVVGAARENWKVGHVIFKNLLENKHILALPVNPNAVEILGKKCYKDLYEIPYNIDCVIIAVPAAAVLSVMNQAARRKVKSAVIVSAGFSEAGNSDLEKEIEKIALDNGISVLGPNCFGFINPYKEINNTFFSGIPEKGGIAFISQSGALGVGVLDLALKEKTGFSGFVALGNSMMLDFSDFIDYYSEDRNTKVITIYMEGLKQARGTRFIDSCLACKKPIIILKSGKSEEGMRASQSHTAALASEQGVYESIFKQARIIEVNSMRELFQTAELFIKLGKIGNRACIVTNAGGLGVLVSDACSRNKIEVPKLPEKTLEKIGKTLPNGWSRGNPIDLVGDALSDRYWQVLSRIDTESWFDFFIILLTPQYMTQPNDTAELLTHLKKPVIACFYGGNKIDGARILLKNNNIPVFWDAEDLGRALGKIT